MIFKRQMAWIGLAVFLGCGEALAQQADGVAGESAAVAGRKSVRIREVLGLGRNVLLRTPQYNTTGGLTVKMPPKEWAEISVIFDTPPGRDVWLDDLGVQFYVLLRNRVGGEYSLLRNSQQLFDVGAGRGRQSAMFVRPPALSRFGDIVSVAVELRVKGEVVDAMSDTKLPGGGKLPDKWWENPKLTVREGYLLKKSDTPFAMLAVDDYEYVK